MKKYSFVAIDIEKANNEPTSLCSIGLAFFKNGKIIKQKEYTVRPYPYMFYKGVIANGKTTYHGIPFEVYEKACTFDKIWPKIEKSIKGEILVGHGINGDILSLQNALEYYGIKADWLQTCERICTNVASIYVYPECASHKLGRLCDYLGIEISPHHALSDARACGLLLLDMLDVTECVSVDKFLNTCEEYKKIITNDISPNNIAKYEDKIMSMFNYDKRLIKATFNSNKVLIDGLMHFFKDNQSENYSLPTIRVVQCLSPIIEICKNKSHEKYINSLRGYIPFVNDGFLYIKRSSRNYIIFVGLILDKTDLIQNIFALLSRDQIRINESNYLSKIVRNYKKNLYSVNLLIKYMREVEHFDDYDIYEYIEYLYNCEVEKTKSTYYKKKYSMSLNSKSYADGYNICLSFIKERMRMLGIYDALVLNFPVFSDGLKISHINERINANIFYQISDTINNGKSNKELEKALNIWFSKNIENF